MEHLLSKFQSLTSPFGVFPPRETQVELQNDLDLIGNQGHSQIGVEEKRPFYIVKL